MSDRGLQYYQQLGQQEQEKAELMEMYQKMLSNEEFLKEYNKIVDGELIGDNNG